VGEGGALGAVARQRRKDDMQLQLTLPGLSWLPYTYFAFDLFTDWLEVPANYAFARLAPGLGGGWTVLYFGEAENLRRRIIGHERFLEAIALGATHLLGHRNYAGDEARRAEERDLIARHNPTMNVQHRTQHAADALGLSGLGSLPGGIGSLAGGIGSPCIR